MTGHHLLTRIFRGKMSRQISNVFTKENRCNIPVEIYLVGTLTLFCSYKSMVPTPVSTNQGGWCNGIASFAGRCLERDSLDNNFPIHLTHFFLVQPWLPAKTEQLHANDKMYTKNDHPLLFWNFLWNSWKIESHSWRGMLRYKTTSEYLSSDHDVLTIYTDLSLKPACNQSFLNCLWAEIRSLSRFE